MADPTQEKLDKILWHMQEMLPVVKATGEVSEETNAVVKLTNDKVDNIDSGGGDPGGGGKPPTEQKDNARPLADSNGMLDRTCFDVFEGNLTVGRYSFGNSNYTISKEEGLSIGFRLPDINGSMIVSMTDKSAGPSPRYGVWSKKRSFSAPFYDEHSWGTGGKCSARVNTVDSGKVIYFNIKATDWAATGGSCKVVLNCTFEGA